jgi:hypothetical protein
MEIELTEDEFRYVAHCVAHGLTNNSPEDPNILIALTEIFGLYFDDHLGYVTEDDEDLA